MFSPNGVLFSSISWFRPSHYLRPIFPLDSIIQPQYEPTGVLNRLAALTALKRFRMRGIRQKGIRLFTLRRGHFTAGFESMFRVT